MQKTERNWAFIISPCIVIIGLLIGFFIYEYATVRRGHSSGYLTIFVVVSIPYAVVTLGMDMLIKRFLRNKEQKAGYIWGIESILLVCCAIVFYYVIQD